MGLRKPRKRSASRECKVREVGTSLNPPPLPKRVETGLMGLRKSRKRGGSRECKVREVGTSLTPPPPKKKVLYVFQRFFCPVGDERSLSVILFSDWWSSTKCHLFVCLRADVSYFLCCTRKRDVPFPRAKKEIGDVGTQATCSLESFKD